MKELEERNKELLEKINEGRLNKIEKVEVYKHDEFDDVPQKEEKTKGQEFAEHLKRQFAALDDEDISSEDLIAMQDFDDKKDESKEKSESEDCRTENAKNFLIEEIDSPRCDERSEAHEKHETQLKSNSNEVSHSTDQVDKFKREDQIVSTDSQVHSTFIREILEDIFEGAFMSLSETNCLDTKGDNVEPSEESDLEEENEDKLNEATEVTRETAEHLRSKCSFYNDCVCLVNKEEDKMSNKSERLSEDFSIQETHVETVTDQDENRNVDNADVIKPHEKRNVDFNINWDQFLKGKRPSKVEESDGEEDAGSQKTEEPTEVVGTDGDSDILTRILNNPKSINPVVADMIVKYWNRRMEEIRKEKPLNETLKKCLDDKEKLYQEKDKNPKETSVDDGVELQDSSDDDDKMVPLVKSPAPKYSLLRNKKRMTYQHRLLNLNRKNGEDKEEEEKTQQFSEMAKGPFMSGLR